MANNLQAIDRAGSRSRPAILKKPVCGACYRGLRDYFCVRFFLLRPKSMKHGGTWKLQSRFRWFQHGACSVFSAGGCQRGVTGCVHCPFRGRMPLAKMVLSGVCRVQTGLSWNGHRRPWDWYRFPSSVAPWAAPTVPLRRGRPVLLRSLPASGTPPPCGRRAASDRNGFSVHTVAPAGPLRLQRTALVRRRPPSPGVPCLARRPTDLEETLTCPAHVTGASTPASRPSWPRSTAESM